MSVYHNENNKYCCEVLRKRFPNSYVDDRSIEDVKGSDLKGFNEVHFFAGIGGFSLGFERSGIPTSITVWTGGFPCQDLSLAGGRLGLAGSRSGLYFKFHDLITTVRPEYVILENVPGLLSSNEGRDFAIVIGGLTGVVPEIPKEGWGNAGLFRGPVYNVAYRVLDARFFGVPQRRRRVFIVGSLGNGGSAKILFEKEFSTRTHTKVGNRRNGIAETFTVRTGKDGGGKGYLGSVDLAMTLGGQPQWVYVPGVGVRSFTPVERERLQGFPDDWTEGGSDAQRYAQARNAVAVPIAQWLGRRIVQYYDHTNSRT